MIYARPGGTFEATLDGAPTGLTGTLLVSIIDTPTGTVVTAETTAGIVEAPAGSKLYSVTLTAPEAVGQYSVVWRNPVPDPDVYAREELFVSGVIPQDTLTVSTPNGVSFGDLTTRLRALTSLTVPEAHARINQAYRRMVIDGRALRQLVEIGPTVVGQSAYLLDPGIVEIPRLRVNGYAYERKSVDELDDLTAHDAYVAGAYRGFFAPDFSAAAAPSVSIYPSPTAAGQTIKARAYVMAPDMTDDAEYPRLPADFHEDLIDGALSVAFRRDDERLQEADALEARFLSRIRDLRGRENRRVGSGPHRVRVRR